MAVGCQLPKLCKLVNTFSRLDCNNSEVLESYLGWPTLDNSKAVGKLPIVSAIGRLN